MSYVELMQTDLFVRLGLLDRVLWDALYPIAWIPCVVAAALGIGALTRQGGRSLCWIALALSSCALLWWLLQPYMWR